MIMQRPLAWIVLPKNHGIGPVVGCGDESWARPLQVSETPPPVTQRAGRIKCIPTCMRFPRFVEEALRAACGCVVHAGGSRMPA